MYSPTIRNHYRLIKTIIPVIFFFFSKQKHVRYHHTPVHFWKFFVIQEMIVNGWTKMTAMILPADEGQCTVVMDKQEYEDRVPALLSDTKTYEVLKKTRLHHSRPMKKSMSVRSFSSTLIMWMKTSSLRQKNCNNNTFAFLDGVVKIKGGPTPHPTPPHLTPPPGYASVKTLDARAGTVVTTVQDRS